MVALAIVALSVESNNYHQPDKLVNASDIRPDLKPESLAAAVFGAELVIKPMVHHHTHPTPAQIAAKEVTKEMFIEWSRVNVCEEHGDWHVKGSEFSGGLGISNHNWTSHHGRDFTYSAANATPDEQIVVARRIQKNPPDQHGCGNGW